uniref:Phosphoinositide phospholipase C (EC) n=1 Tax=Ganoderma boninense TaxID=34458 RepID=A0A5K1JT28_9APHY|nr:Phosphoinositide phospholipase C (EC [Ganoderma boninense]
MPSITPRKTRSRKLPAKPDQPPNRGRAGPSPTGTMRNDTMSEGKNNRKRSSNNDEETCPTPPRKKRATNASPPTAGPSTVSTRDVLRRSTRKASHPSRKEANEPAEPDSGVIVVDDDGYPYVAYDDAPHLHPPPRRGKQKESDLPAGFRGKIKGCSIKPCWTPTQQRRCRILQTDEAVQEIGWKKVRKWMQAVRCGLCGETQVLRDLTKGCFNLEHWWRHLRVRHGIKRDEEFEEKGEEKYKALPMKDHVCTSKNTIRRTL